MIEQVIRLIQGDPQDQKLKETVKEMLKDIENSCPFRIQYRIEPIKKSNRGFLCQRSQLLLEGNLADTMLRTCDQIVVLVCTLGYPFEQKLAYYAQKDVALSLIWDACGSIWIENQLDQFEKELSVSYLTDRFSCGYGDLPLSLQNQIVSSLPNIGIHVLPSHMMYPTKSVSAFLGISSQKQPARIKGCAYCTMNKHCPYKKKEKNCGI